MNPIFSEPASLFRSNYLGCGSIFGRGRSLLFVICALIGLMSVLQNSARDGAAAFVQPPTEPYGVPARMLSGWAHALIRSAGNTPVPANYPLPVQSRTMPQPTVSFAAPTMAQATISTNQPGIPTVVPAGYALQLVKIPTTQPQCTCAVQQPVRIPVNQQAATYATQLQPIQSRTFVTNDNLQRLLAVHGGSLEGSRATVARSVGQRLATANGLHSIRFDVLADTRRAAAYALESGNILITAAAVDQMRAQDKIAAVLARQLEYYLDNRGANLPAEQLMARAGFSPSLLLETDRYLSAWRQAEGQPTILATHITPN